MNKKFFSVCMSVYKNDNPLYLKEALDSLINQSLPPAEIVLVEDGPIPDSLNHIINEFEKKYNVFNIIKIPENKGLGYALNVAITNAKYDIIARMDSDDICFNNRFEVQIEFLESHPNVDIVGGQITEFIDKPDNIVCRRKVPLTNEEIYLFMKTRCGLNHVTVMFKRSSVLKVGNYQDWFWNEDYYLWVRMMKANCIFANISNDLVNVRTGMDQYARRGGKKYFESEIGIQRLMLENNLISKFQYANNIAKRFVLELVMPRKIRGWFFRVFARTK
jgi:glycosyltransferase involved in cell wall biosynthesis